MTRLSHGDSSRLADALRQQHRCSPSCACCVPEPREKGALRDWFAFVGSDDALRVARIAKRKGWEFPRFSPDDVIQLLVEEALMERVDREEHEAAQYREAHDDAHARVQAELARVAGGVR